MAAYVIHNTRLGISSNVYLEIFLKKKNRKKEGAVGAWLTAYNRKLKYVKLVLLRSLDQKMANDSYGRQKVTSEQKR